VTEVPQAARDNRGRWQKGGSGNPIGRPRGSKNKRHRRAGDLERAAHWTRHDWRALYRRTFHETNGDMGKSERRRPASASLFGCCSIRRLSGRACAPTPTAASHSMCLEARSAARPCARMLRGCTGVVCRGFSEIGGVRPRSSCSGSASQSARFDLTKHQVGSGVSHLRSLAHSARARAACSRPLSDLFVPPYADSRRDPLCYADVRL